MARRAVCEDSEDESLSPVIARRSTEPIEIPTISTSTNQRSTDSTNTKLQHAHDDLFGSVRKAIVPAESSARKTQRSDADAEYDESPAAKKPKVVKTIPSCLSSPGLDQFRSSAVQAAIEKEIIRPSDPNATEPPAATELIGTTEHNDLVRAALDDPVKPTSSGLLNDTTHQPSSIPVTWPSVDTRTPSTSKSRKSAATTTTTSASRSSPAADLAEIQASDSYYKPRPSSRRAKAIPEPVADWHVRPEVEAKKTKSTKKTRSTARSAPAASSPPPISHDVDNVVPTPTVAGNLETTAPRLDSDLISPMVLTNSPSKSRIEICLPRPSSKSPLKRKSSVVLEALAATEDAMTIGDRPADHPSARKRKSERKMTASPEPSETEIRPTVVEPSDTEEPVATLETLSTDTPAPKSKKGKRKTTKTKVKKASKGTARKAKPDLDDDKLPDDVDDKLEKPDDDVDKLEKPDEAERKGQGTDSERPGETLAKVDLPVPSGEPEHDENAEPEDEDASGDASLHSKMRPPEALVATVKTVAPQSKPTIKLPSPIKGRPLYRVGLSKRGSVPSLLKMVKK